MTASAISTSTTPAAAAKALLHWADKLNAAAYARQSKNGTNRLRRFVPCGSARVLIDASYSVMREDDPMGVEDAMALIHWGETGEAIRRLSS